MSTEDIGYLKRAVEDLHALVKDHMEREEKERAELEEQLKTLAQTQQNIIDELSLYKMVVRGAKILGALIILIVTLKFGDIPKLFH